MKSTFASALFIGLVVIWLVSAVCTFYSHFFGTIGEAVLGVAQHLAGR